MLYVTLTMPGTSRIISLGELLEDFEREPRRCCGPRIDAFPAAHLDLLAEIALAVAHAGHAVFMKDRHVLECTGVLEQPLDNDGCLADRLDALRGHFADHACRERRPRERDALERSRPEARGPCQSF